MAKRIIPYEENHKTINGVLYKQCSICGEWFPCTAEHFYKNNCSKQDGLFPYCKQCSITKAYRWKKANPERFKISEKKYRQTEKFHNSDLKTSQKRAPVYAEWRRQNKDKVKKYNKKHKKHELSEAELQQIYEYANSSCMYCGITETEAIELYKQRLHKDHAYHNGSDNISNCILCCKGCNSWKKKRNWDEWYTPDKSIFSQDRFDKIKFWIESFE